MREFESVMSTEACAKIRISFSMIKKERFQDIFNAIRRSLTAQHNHSIFEDVLEVQ
jgi:hypothetical protein